MSDLPQGWRFAAMNDLVKLTRRKVEVLPDQLYREIGIRSHGKGIFHKEPILGEDIGSKRVFWVKPGDFTLNIVFAWEGAVGLISDREHGMIASHRFPTFVAVPGICDTQYLLRYFQSTDGVDQLKSVSPGGAGRNKTLNQSAFLRLKIPTPPLPEQRKIATIISTWEGAITLMGRLIAVLHQHKQALRQLLLTGEAFGDWKQVRLSQVGQIILSNVDKKNEDGEASVRLCNYMDVYSNSWITNTHSFMEATASPLEILKFRLRKYDVILTKDSETAEDIAQTAVVMEDLDNVICGYHLAIIRPNDSVYGPFLKELLMSPDIHYQFESAANGVTRYGLTQASIANVVIPLPKSLANQRKITDVLMANGEYQNLLRKYSMLLQQQKRSLMQQLLTGAIRVQVDD